MTDVAPLRVEDELPSLASASAWLNSEPLTPAALRGKVVLVEFWTYTCINWLRTMPYVRAWAEKYRNRGLVVIGVHSPEFELLLFPGVQIIDYSAPYEVFSQAAVYNIFTVAESSAPISTSGGPGAAQVTAKYTFADHPKPDIVIIPGGGGSRPGDGGVGNQTANPKLIRWIQEQAGSATTVLSVCNGAFLLAKAGLLDGLEATTFWGMLDDLRLPRRTRGYTRTVATSTTER